MSKRSNSITVAETARAKGKGKGGRQWGANKFGQPAKGKGGDKSWPSKP